MNSSTLNNTFNKITGNKIFKSLFNNYGEIMFRLVSKTFLIILSFLLDDKLFGSLVLVIVVETIMTNILRFGQDRRLLSSEENTAVPIKEYLILLVLACLIFYFVYTKQRNSVFLSRAYRATFSPYRAKKNAAFGGSNFSRFAQY